VTCPGSRGWIFLDTGTRASAVNEFVKYCSIYNFYREYGAYMKRRTFLRSVTGAAALTWSSTRTLHSANRLGALESQALCDRPPDSQGLYFSKKACVLAPLPQFEETRSQLPSPIDDDHPLWIETYWKAWELAFKNFHQPSPKSGFVSNFIDAAFNENIFLFDSCFMTMFCNYGYPLVPGISTLDNFYARQYMDGEIGREIGRATGVDYEPWINREDKPLFTRWGWWGWPSPLNTHKIDRDTAVIYKGRKAPSPNPRLTLDTLDHPILPWAELEYQRLTGDDGRLSEVWESLVRYYGAFQKYLQQGNGLYITDWGSMDNSPRNVYLKNGGTAIDTSAEMVLFARQLAEIAGTIGKTGEAARFSGDADELSRKINHLMWDPRKNFYFDLTIDGKRSPVKTIAPFWTLIAHIASPSQASALVSQLKNPSTFGRLNKVPSVPADEPGYDPAGSYWRGGVWAPMVRMVTRGLEKYDYIDLARELALNHLNLVAEVYKKTGTIWENYSPDAQQQGNPAKSNFVGWTGMGPIVFLLEYAVGLKADAPTNTLDWQLTPGGRRGCERFRFNRHVVSLVAQPTGQATGGWRITVQSDSPFELRVRSRSTEKKFSVATGSQEFEV